MNECFFRFVRFTGQNGMLRQLNFNLTFLLERERIKTADYLKFEALELAVDFIVFDEIKSDRLVDGIDVGDFVSVSDAIEFVSRFKKLGSEGRRDELRVVFHFVHHFRDLNSGII